MQRGLSKSTTPQLNVREVFSRQPAHSLIIDTVRPCDLETIHTIETATENFFCLVCSLTGPCRIACFSLLASCARTEMLLPLQKVTKALFPRLRTSFHELTAMIKQQPFNSPVRDYSSLQQTIQVAANNFTKFKELSAFNNQLEITILTCRNTENINSFAGEIVRSLNLSEVKKIEFVSLSNDESHEWSQNVMEDFVSQDIHNTADEDNEVAGFWNAMHLDCNITSLESYFKNWLKDESTDKEHLKLQVNEIYIKCDMQERLLNPDELPFRTAFCIGSDLYMGTTAQGPRCQSRPESIPIINLRAKKVIPYDAVCESIVFGRPVVLVTSACWQMDWDELETNQNHFLSLCKRLEREHECLICENITKQQGRHRNYSLSNLEQPKGLFVILPSSTSSLLLKAISPKELLIPTQIESSLEECGVPNSAMDEIESALDVVGSNPIYNPLEHDSGLCDSLKITLLPKPTSGSSSRPVQKKPRLQTVSSSRFNRR